MDRFLYAGLPPTPARGLHPEPHDTAHRLCCAFGAWKKVCSTVAVRRFRVRRREAIHSPTFKQRQAPLGRDDLIVGGYFEDKSRHTKDVSL